MSTSHRQYRVSAGCAAILARLTEWLLARLARPETGSPVRLAVARTAVTQHRGL